VTFAQLANLRGRLLRWASAGVWLSCLIVACVALWCAIDPFGMRQRLDWLVSDQFLRVRHAPPMHDDIALIAIDDGTVEQFGYPLPRSVLAGAIRQLQNLQVRSILVDILLAEPQRKPVLEESEPWLIQAGSVISQSELGDRLSDVKERFTEDQVLARAMRSARSVTIPFAFLSKQSEGRFRAVRSGDELQPRMIEMLQAQPGLGTSALASQLGVDEALVRPQFGPALETAMLLLARQHLERNPQEDVEDSVAKILPEEARESFVGISLRRALDRAAAERVIRGKASRQAETIRRARSRENGDEIKPPRYLLADAAADLGFADIQLDADGTLRRIGLAGPWSDRTVFHQALAALVSHRGLGWSDLKLERGSIADASGSLRISVDSSNQLTVNWPVDRSRRWSDVIPSIPLADLYGMDRDQSLFTLLRHRRRESMKEMARLSDRDTAAADHFDKIIAALRRGELDEAARLEEAFDRDEVPRVASLSGVQSALELARTTAPPQSSDVSEPGPVQYARAVVEFEARIASIESDYQASLAELLPYVRGKMCLIGDTTTGSTDLKRTPADESMPGVAVIASALSTMLTAKPLTILGFVPSAILMVAICALLATPFLRLGALTAGACAVLGITLPLFGSYLMLTWRSLFVSPVTPVAGLVGMYLTTTTYRWLKEYREKRLVRTIFEAQTNPMIVERLIDAGHAGVEEVLAPKNRQVTVFFAEIADYDDLARRVTPERMPEFLSRTFGTMAKLVLAHEGTLDRYQGNAMVAFFGAPVYQPDHAQRACRAALECCDTLRDLESAWRERDLPAPRVHVGVHTGELLVGNITLTSRVDYTVAGENLNVAYRIGELNEVYGTQIMISEATLTRCENMVEARELDMVRIKGRREPIRAFELMSAKGRLSQGQLQMRGTFSTGLIAFRNKDYAGALAMFRSCRETSPGDRPATIYIERCQRELAPEASNR
jgi:class 3 adenylate cyclase/CHASE2 domain-containing sensor protein